LLLALVLEIGVVDVLDGFGHDLSYEITTSDNTEGVVGPIVLLDGASVPAVRSKVAEGLQVCSATGPDTEQVRGKVRLVNDAQKAKLRV
jgi:hypothetical protein